MVTNGISSGVISAAIAATQNALTKAADTRKETASIEAQVKDLEAQHARLQRPAINQAAMTGLRVMANRQISVGSGANSARAREAGGNIRNHLASASRGLGALLGSAKTLLKGLQDYLFAASAKESTPAGRAAAGLGLETRTAGPRIE